MSGQEMWALFGFADADQRQAWLDRARSAGLLQMNRDGMFGALIATSAIDVVTFVAPYLTTQETTEA